MRSGRFGDYLEVELTSDEEAAGTKPRRISLPKGVTPLNLTTEQAVKLLSFPRDLGTHAELGEPMVVTIGKFGPYLKCGTETRNIPSWETAADITPEEAVELLATEAVKGRGKAATPAEPIQTFPAAEGTAGPMKVLAGRYGPYVTDGKYTLAQHDTCDLCPFCRQAFDFSSSSD